MFLCMHRPDKDSQISYRMGHCMNWTLLYPGPHPLWGLICITAEWIRGNCPGLVSVSDFNKSLKISILKASIDSPGETRTIGHLPEEKAFSWSVAELTNMALDSLLCMNTFLSVSNSIHNLVWGMGKCTNDSLTQVFQVALLPFHNSILHHCECIFFDLRLCWSESASRSKCLRIWFFNLDSMEL